MTSRDQARQQLSSVQEVEARASFRPAPWAVTIVSLAAGLFLGSLAYHAWWASAVIFVLLVVLLWALRGRLFRTPRKRLNPQEDPLKDPYIRGSWGGFALDAILLGIVIFSPGGSWAWAIAAGFVGIIWTWYFVLRERHYS